MVCIALWGCCLITPLRAEKLTQKDLDGVNQRLEDLEETMRDFQNKISMMQQDMSLIKLTLKGGTTMENDNVDDLLKKKNQETDVVNDASINKIISTDYTQNTENLTKNEEIKKIEPSKKIREKPEDQKNKIIQTENSKNENYKETNNLEKFTTKEVLERARKLLAEKKNKEARDFLLNQMENNSNKNIKTALLNLLAKAYYALKDFDNALINLINYAKNIKDAEEKENVMLRIGIIFYDKKDFDKAKQAFEPLLKSSGEVAQSAKEYLAKMKK